MGTCWQISRVCPALVLAIVAIWGSNVEAADPVVQFITDVEPIFRKHCYRCHGEVQDKAGLRLSRRAAAFGVADSDEPVIIAGKPEQSLLIKRITDAEAGELMPPDGEPLSKQEIAILRRWIKSGANWPDSVAVAKHWAYQPVVRPALPKVDNERWANNPIDRFVLKKLQERGIKPSRETDRVHWIRRVSLALTGLPPTLQEIDAFLEDRTETAYEKVVDRLLASKRFGEKWAIGWLDLARYADSNGFQADQIRDSWAYRDWVINALNRDMPFDQFVIEQLAGDLLPNASFEQKVATGFHRTVTCNVEAGVHPEENRTNQIFDRVNTTGTVFLGTSLECAQCHDHKYDPFDQKDYYRLFAYFNNTPLEVKDTGGGVTWDFYGPKMELPLPPEKQKQRDILSRELAVLKEEKQKAEKENGKSYRKWLEKISSGEPRGQWQVLSVHNFSSTGNEEFEILEDGSILVTGPVPGKTVYEILARSKLKNITAIKVEALTHEKLPGNGPGRGDKERTNFILNELSIHLQQADRRSPVKISRAIADFSQKKWDVSGAIDGNPQTGWAIAPHYHQPHWAIFALSDPLDMQESSQLMLRLDQNYGHGRTIGRLRISAYSGDAEIPVLPDEIRKLAVKRERTKEEEKKLREFHRKQNRKLIELNNKITEIRDKLKKTEPPTTLVMVEMEKPRETHILSRGNYLSPLEKVTPGVPALFDTGNDQYPPNRLGLANWLVSDHNPLLTRVTVNRWWAELFGRGIVRTLEDFGSQGEVPTHPELLDWLASELRENGWSMKKIIKTIVLSQTYRQSSQFTNESEKDPENKWYSRGPRFRLTAELIRDNALAISGLLSDKMGGPPVMPYQPGGIWRSIGRNQPKWITAQNEDRFRRGVYIIWKRDAPYPSLVSFDAPDRTACVVNRSKTNTPLQALTLLNDPAYSEMAVGLAIRMLSEPRDKTDRGRIIYGFRLCLSREPKTDEIDILLDLLKQERAAIRKNPQLVKERVKIVLPGFPMKIGAPQETAVWFAISNALLNLDETITQ